MLRRQLIALGLGVVLAAASAPPVSAHDGNTDPSVLHGCAGTIAGIRLVGPWGACAPTETPHHWVNLKRFLDLLERVAMLENAVNAVLALVSCVSLEPGPINGVGGPHLLITGCNVHIRSGSGATVDTTNLGNLIIGYNEPRGFTNTSNRTGSHNVVLGPEHQFTASGGFLAGDGNTVTADFASVSGGTGNTASGAFSSVSGGQTNTAHGPISSVSGGGHNTASGGLSSVSGGFQNTAGGDDSSVSGGLGHTAGGNRSSVSGGNSRTAPGTDDWA